MKSQWMLVAALTLCGCGSTGGPMVEGPTSQTLAAPSGQQLWQGRWSPDGTTVYFSGDNGILKVPAAGGAVTLVKSSFAAMNIDVSKDGQRLSYSVNGSNNVTVLELSDGGQTELGKGQAGRFSTRLGPPPATSTPRGRRFSTGSTGKAACGSCPAFEYGAHLPDCLKLNG